jgi:RNA recognition motif-containing protein
MGNSKSSMGCGVVEFASRDIAVHAVALLNESELKGRTIRCREDRDPEDETPADHAPATSVPARKAPKKAVRNTDEPRVAEPNKVFVTSLTWDTTDNDLSQLFGTVGTVVSSEILSTRKGRSMGSGIVEFSDPASVAAAIASLNNVDFKGRNIVVREYYQ